MVVPHTRNLERDKVINIFGSKVCLASTIFPAVTLKSVTNVPGIYIVDVTQVLFNS